jgi:hypothetical protein
VSGALPSHASAAALLNGWRRETLQQLRVTDHAPSDAFKKWRFAHRFVAGKDASAPVALAMLYPPGYPPPVSTSPPPHGSTTIGKSGRTLAISLRTSAVKWGHFSTRSSQSPGSFLIASK